MLEYAYLAAVLAAALYLFWSQRLRTDVTAVLVMLSLIVPWPRDDGSWRGVLTHEEAFSGFSSSAVIMIAAMFVIGGAIVQTGAAEAWGMRLLRRAADREWRLQMTVLGMATLASMFINDTTVVLIMLPLIISLCRERDLPPSRYLLFAAYGSLLGGQWTLIGTRSNIIISDFLRSYTGTGIGFFDFTPLAAPIFGVSALFLLLIGRRFLPARKPAEPAGEIKEFVTELTVPEGSPAIGRPLSELEQRFEGKLTAAALIRSGERIGRGAKLRAGDLVIVRGTVETIGKLFESSDFSIREEAELDREALKSVDLVTIEAVIPANSHYVGQRLRKTSFRRNYGVTAIGMGHRGQAITARMVDETLQPGDSLLFLGGAGEVQRLRSDPGLTLLEPRTFPVIGKAWVVSLLLAGVVVTSASGLLSPAITIPLAGAGAVLFGCISLRAAYEAIDWPTIVTLGGMIPFGIALETTGAAAGIANLVVETLSTHGSLIVLAATLLIALLLTQVIENAAAAIIVAPVILQIATAMQLDPAPMMIALGVVVSAGFTTPVAHESTILVMGPGQYQFRHYLITGSALAITTWLGATLLAPLI